MEAALTALRLYCDLMDPGRHSNVTTGTLLREAHFSEDLCCEGCCIFRREFCQRNLYWVICVGAQNELPYK